MVIRGTLLAAAFLLAAPALPAQTLGQQVNGAIKSGVAYLKGKQMEDGNFDAGSRGVYPDGVAAFVLLALVKSGVPQSDPVVRKALDTLRYRPHTRTYSTAIRILALDALKNEEHAPAIRAAADWLVSKFRKSERLWGYPDGSADLSNTQYAALGLWTAERHGHETPRDLWTALASQIVKHQTRDGGFSYRTGQEGRGSMTCAGITVLTLCAERISKGEVRRLGVGEAISRGWQNLERRFHPGGNPVGEHAFSNLHYYYYLYGLERVCALGDRRKLGGRDWYKEGAAALVKLQHDNGSWGTVENTCFALLFLRLSTYTTIGRKKETGLDGAAGTRKGTVRPRAEIPFLSRWLLLGPFDDPDESALGRPLIDEGKVNPRPGGRTRGKRWKPFNGQGNRIDLNDAFGKTEHAVAYAFCRLDAEAREEATLWFGSADGARLFLDGSLLHENRFRINESTDRHAIPVALEPGPHTLLVKVATWTGPWGFSLRISRRDGSPFPAIVAYTDPGGPTPRERLVCEAPFMTAAEIGRRLELDRKGKLTFDSRDALERVFIVHNRDAPAWHDVMTADNAFRGQDGAQGILALHPIDTQHPVRIYRKVRVAASRARLVARVSAIHPERTETGDWLARFGVLERNAVAETAAGTGIRWFPRKVIASGTKSAPAGWIEIEQPIGEYAGGDILVILECTTGGPGGDWNCEHAFVDEFSVR